MYYNQPFFFFFNDTATTEIYTLSLHDALPISHHRGPPRPRPRRARRCRSRQTSARRRSAHRAGAGRKTRSEEHTSELQSLTNLVCRLLLEKKKSDESYAHHLRYHRISPGRAQ